MSDTNPDQTSDIDPAASTGAEEAATSPTGAPVDQSLDIQVPDYKIDDVIQAAAD
ncbi:hypothetical protein ACIQOV_06930 [Kitasatospora sp. NPDC091257]|uniref:hypothetical protein n=1 Tax=Kitasatospora sp. NPDC091257 TaxID=3364084 RepID=UPI0038162C84